MEQEQIDRLKLEVGRILPIEDGQKYFAHPLFSDSFVRIDPGEKSCFPYSPETLVKYGADEMWELEGDDNRTMVLYVKKVPTGRQVVHIEQDMFE